MKTQPTTRHWVVAAIAVFGVGQLWAAHFLTLRLAASPAGLNDSARWLVLILVALMVIGELYAAVGGTRSG